MTKVERLLRGSSEHKYSHLHEGQYRRRLHKPNEVTIILTVVRQTCLCVNEPRLPSGGRDELRRSFPASVSSPSETVSWCRHESSFRSCPPHPPTVSKKPPISQWIVGQDVSKVAGVAAAWDRKARQASSESASGITDWDGAKNQLLVTSSPYDVAAAASPDLHRASE